MKILMVCLGNICRSPLAQGILEAKIRKYQLSDWEVDSAGTSGWHDGEAPDNRAIVTATSHDIDISKQVSRRITHQDFDYYDLVLAMDTSNYRDLLRFCPNVHLQDKIQMIMNYQFPNRNIAVPDPYYDGKFDEVYSLLDEAMEYLIHAYK